MVSDRPTVLVPVFPEIILYGHDLICWNKGVKLTFLFVICREPNVAVPPPEFIVKQITQPRFVLLVEETGNMNLRVRHSLSQKKRSNVA